MMMYVTKADGSKQPFDESKLERSLRGSGASPETVGKVLEHLKVELTPGMTTSELYKHAFFLLHKFQKNAAITYSLRRAIMDLGPTGFPFEKYIARVFQENGYTTLTGQTVKGGCVEHEVDVVAWNDQKLIMTEAKFHNHLGVKTDLKVALYVKARFDDLRENTFFYGHRRPVDESWLITNTKFTTTAIEYGMCKGLTMYSWNFPAKGNLRDMIEDKNLHPITCLASLSRAHTAQLINQGVVLCKELAGHDSALKNLGLSAEARQHVMEEISALL